MKKRQVHVSSIEIKTIIFSSILSIGDTKKATPTSRVIATQQPHAIYNTNNEPTFTDFPIFSMQQKWPDNPIPVVKQTIQHKKNIFTKNVSILGVSSASIVQIGSVEKVKTESRVKHIRKVESDSTKSPLQMEEAPLSTR